VESRFGRVAVKFAEHRGWIFDALFPRACIRCGGEGAAFCVSCVEAWVPNVLRNRCPFCEQGAVGATCKDCRGKVFLDGLVAVLSYGDPVVRQALTAWKYYGDEAVRTFLHETLARMICLFRLFPFIRIVVANEDLIKRKRLRLLSVNYWEFRAGKAWRACG